MRKIVSLVVLWTIVVFSPGCLSSGSSGSNAHWYNPGTWFSGAEGRKVEVLVPQIDAAKDKLRKDAQKSVHQVQVALQTAPQEDRSVQVAAEAANNAVADLDQTEGPLTNTDLSALTKQVKQLVSEVAAERAEGEKARAEERATNQKTSVKLDKLSDALGTAQTRLLQGFERENAMANTLRNYQFGVIGLAVLFLLAAAGYVYVKVVAGGVPKVLGNVLTRFRVTSPVAASELTNLLDVNLTPAQQAIIASHTA